MSVLVCDVIYDRSRTFMRLNGGNVRFLAVDEPTSALDPEGEFELFKRLREQREGKTVVFITHRFGHLTKHADMILYVWIPHTRIVDEYSSSRLLVLDV